ncbi:fibronectin type III domain-containing protein [Tumebacillus permanentifrigoris]|uniref:Fibronectin type III domain protein n=1 Tax=Tumebacillus permanentifrigoris TaxID=378543 RepID=A0A316DAC8_9BACL|nr:fibronectin type III domain-containing protein [Tumebacillus permanentifrigoris]PWK13451.1 fibronectin type III domain protein [Tumebacillus permanentifrigoris]
MENAGFESYTTGNGVADKWVAYQPSTATGSYRVVNSPVQEGSQAQRFEFRDMNQIQRAHIDQFFDIDPGAEYEISGYFNVESLTRSQIQLAIDYFDAAGTLIDSNVTNQSQLTNGYVRLQTIKVANLQAVKCRISVILLATADDASGAFTVDQFALRKTNGALVNPGFEEYHGMYEVADSWRFGYSPRATLAQKVVSSPVASGVRAQKVSAAGLPYWGYSHVVQVVTAREGVSYTVGGKFNIAELNGSKAQLYVDYYDANYKHLGSDYTDRTTTTNGYVLVQNKTTAPKNAAFLQVWTLLRATADNGAGTIYVDDVSVVGSTDLPLEQPIIDLTPMTSSTKLPVVAGAVGESAWLLGYDFQTPTVVREYELSPILNFAQSNTPNSWTFEGFDGANWQVLDTKTGMTEWNGISAKKFPIANKQAYWQYRLNVTANNGDTQVLDLRNVNMHGYYARPITPQGVWNSAKGDGTITLSWTPANGVTGYNIYQDEKLVKRVSGNVTTATLTNLTNNKVYHYTVSAVNGTGESLKSQDVLAMPYMVARGLKPLVSSGWGGNCATATINFDFQKPTVVREYTWVPGNDAKRTPKKWTFEGFDGTAWIVLDRQSDLPSLPSNTRRYFTLDNTQSFLKYRINNSGTAGDPAYLRLHDIQLIGE